MAACVSYPNFSAAVDALVFAAFFDRGNVNIAKGWTVGFYLFLSHILWLLRKAAIKIMLVDRLKVIIHVFIYHYADMNFILSVLTY